ncbi:putative transcription factor B3-Domain family [Helianthus annuus]|nr:putative transcription factor B3-Domain family [Helianthus annuus]
MSSSCVALLEDESSLKLLLPIEFVKNVYGHYWQRTKILIKHETGKSWPVSLRSVSGESVITDGWSNVIRELELPKRTLLRLRIMEDKNIEIDCFVDNICGESFVTVNRYNILKIVVIPEAYVTNCYTYSPVKDCYKIFAAGQTWNIDTDRINDHYVFTKGCPKLFDDLAIQEDDILLLKKTDTVTFELKIYRRGVGVVFTKKEESEDDSLMEVPRDTYYKNVNFNFCEDDDSTDEMVSKEIQRLLGDNQEKVNKNNEGKEMSKAGRKSLSIEDNNQARKGYVLVLNKIIDDYL